MSRMPTGRSVATAARGRKAVISPEFGSPVENLLVSIFDGLPRASLVGAACIGHSPLFDDVIDDETSEDRNYRHAKAALLCNRCPVAERCREATIELPPGTTGVWAGELLARRPLSDTA